MIRAYSLLTTKSFEDDADFVTVKGIASTPTPDRMGDIVDPMGAQFVTPMPLLWQHDAQKPVGQVVFANPTLTGIPFTAQIPKVKVAGVLKDRVDEAIHSLKHGLIRAVSIGFSALPGGVTRLKGGGMHFTSWSWLELSLVTIPAQSEAIINILEETMPVVLV